MRTDLSVLRPIQRNVPQSYVEIFNCGDFIPKTEVERSGSRLCTSVEVPLYLQLRPRVIPWRRRLRGGTSDKKPLGSLLSGRYVRISSPRRVVPGCGSSFVVRFIGCLPMEGSMGHLGVWALT